MFGRREAPDPLLAQLVRERLSHLLAEVVPRRAIPYVPPSGVRPRLVDSPPDFEPSDDGWDEEGEGDVRGTAPAGTAVSRPTASTPRQSGPVTAAEFPDGGRRRLGPPRVLSRVHLGVLVGLLLVGLLTAGWAMLRARPVAVATTPLTSATATPAPGSRTLGSGAANASATPKPTPRLVLVHVLGAVRRPGVVSLTEGARALDALAAAGGLTRAADPGDLNLAQILSDGQQIVIGTKRHPTGDVRGGASDSAGQPGSAAAAGSPDVNLNSATQVQLELLPGVGPVMAGKILAWRQEHGHFSRVEELQEIDGIGPKTYAHIVPHVRL